MEREPPPIVREMTHPFLTRSVIRRSSGFVSKEVLMWFEANEKTARVERAVLRWSRDRTWILALSGVVSLGACSPTASPSPSSFSSEDAGGGSRGLMEGDRAPGAGGDLIFGAAGMGHGGGSAQQVFSVEPAGVQTVVVRMGEPAPSLTYTAMLDGRPINAGWGVDRGEIGSIPPGPASEAAFTPNGTRGGVVKIRAGLNDEVIEREVLVKLVSEQNGPGSYAEDLAQVAATVAELTEGGGIGGVGGDGLGIAVTDAGVLAALANPATSGQAEGLRVLYPYDGTVWPRGLPAPLVMWDGSIADADAIRIDLETTSGSFAWTGTFGRPAILAQTGTPFVRHPIPQSVWAAATDSAGGPTVDGSVDRLVARVTIARDGQAYGPIAQTWTVAPARLSGTIFYQSYGTRLARNLAGAVGGDGMFGGAVLSIRVGDAGPALVAGGDGDSSACRVCHSVASGGSRLAVQAGLGTSQMTVGYELSASGSAEFPFPTKSVYPALTPDGSRALGPDGRLFSLPGGEELPVTGLTSVATNLGTPAFSPDGRLIALNPMESVSLGAPAQKLVVMHADSETGTFSNPVVVSDFAGLPPDTRPGWPSFFPDSRSVVFHQQVAAGHDGNGAGALFTRLGAKARITWTTTTDPAHVTALDRLNGLDATGQSYLPLLAAPASITCTGDGVPVGAIDADHGDDANLNYEPTVSPIPAGGYAWVVFVSRRMYGNVATLPPFCSDPRGVDLVQNITTKKLWVAAIDLDMHPGQDGSHPAFYLPGQELLAGNARGFWVFDPCRNDGEGCETGDQCCNGFCAPTASGELSCSDTPPNGRCSMAQERCATSADCCDPQLACINGFCALRAPR
jgi:hypothetical protein